MGQIILVNVLFFDVSVIKIIILVESKQIYRYLMNFFGD